MKILNLGSLNFDRVYDVDHIVAEGETILSQGYAEFLGGKGLNQSLALAKAGAEVYHAGAVGMDGSDLRECLESAGVNTRYLQQIDFVSGHAVIQKSNGQNCIIVCGGANQRVSREYISEVLRDFGDGDLLLVQNETSNVPFAIQQAKARGMKVALNASPITQELLSYPLDLVDYFIINEVEGKALSESDAENFEEILDTLAQRFPHAAIVLTLGKRGVLYRDAQQMLRQSSYKVEVVDTTAAGDTFCGYFLACVGKGMAMADTLRIACQSGALAVGKNGASTSIPTWDDVMAFGASHN